MIRWMLAFVLLSACTPTTVPGGATCETACANINARACDIGGPCLSACKDAPTDLNLACLTEAGSKDALNACGTVKCR